MEAGAISGVLTIILLAIIAVVLIILGIRLWRYTDPNRKSH